jgi:hypothetical protein
LSFISLIHQNCSSLGVHFNALDPMKYIFFILIISVSTRCFSTKIAFQNSRKFCVNQLLLNQMRNSGLDVSFISLTNLEWSLNSGEYSYSEVSLIKNKNEVKNLTSLGFTHLLLPVYCDNSSPVYSCSSPNLLTKSSKSSTTIFKLIELNTAKKNELKLIVNTSNGNDLSLETCSNIRSFMSTLQGYLTSSNTIANEKVTDNEISANSQIIIQKPTIMVMPRKIETSRIINGEYEFTPQEKMMISALKNKFEQNKFTTFGFESTLKRVMENRQISGDVKDKQDYKSALLETAQVDFYVEFDFIESNSYQRTYDFRIRNYSTGEDVASDLKSISSSATPDEYKKFAEEILNQGAISKINTQYQLLLSEGRKINVLFTISKGSNAKFSDLKNGKKIGIHINDFMVDKAYKGIVDLDSESDFRKEVRVNIPVIDPKNGQKYQTTTFAEEIVKYLKTEAGVECDRVVSRQSINIIIK